jgi:hypothetical protein
MQIYDSQIGVVKCFAVYFQNFSVYKFSETTNPAFSINPFPAIRSNPRKKAGDFHCCQG